MSKETVVDEMSSDNGIGRLEGIISGVERELKQLNRMLMGNGQPGVLDRLTRNEEAVEALLRMESQRARKIDELISSMKAFTAAQQTQTTTLQTQSLQLDSLSKTVESLSETVCEVSDVVDDHVKNPKVHSPKGLLLRKDVISIVLGFMLLVMLMFSYLGVDQVVDKILKLIF